MKTSITPVIAIVLAFAAGPVAAEQSGAGHADHAQHGAADAQRHRATGKVVRVSPESGRVTLDHDPVDSLNWPRMTMGFKVKDPALMERLAVGATIEFEFVKQGRHYVVTEIR